MLFSLEEALAILEPGGPWVPVDALDVGFTERLIETEEAFRTLLASGFGAFDIPAAFPKEASSAAAAVE